MVLVPFTFLGMYQNASRDTHPSLCQMLESLMAKCWKASC